MRTIVAALPDYDIVLPSKLDIHRDRVLSLSLPDTPSATISGELSESIRALWADSDLRTAVCHILNDKSHPLTRGSPFDSAVAIYYLDSLDRILSPDYVPTNEDVMMCLHRTSQVEELILENGGRTYRIIDPGGAARTDEKRKWIHQFSRVTAIVFMVSLSDYDCYREQEDGDSPVVSACFGDNFESRTDQVRHLKSVLLEAFNTFDHMMNLKCFKFTNIVSHSKLFSSGVNSNILNLSNFHCCRSSSSPTVTYSQRNSATHLSKTTSLTPLDGQVTRMTWNQPVTTSYTPWYLGINGPQPDKSTPIIPVQALPESMEIQML